MITSILKFGFKFIFWGGIFLFAFPEATVYVISGIASGFAQIFSGLFEIAWESAKVHIKESLKQMVSDIWPTIKDAVLGR